MVTGCLQFYRHADERQFLRAGASCYWLSGGSAYAHTWLASTRSGHSPGSWPSGAVSKSQACSSEILPEVQVLVIIKYSCSTWGGGQRGAPTILAATLYSWGQWSHHGA